MSHDVQHVPRIIEDDRPIRGIYYADGEHGYTVGTHAVHFQKIVAYEEFGDMAPVTWFAVYKDGAIFARVPARLVTVNYS